MKYQSIASLVVTIVLSASFAVAQNCNCNGNPGYCHNGVCCRVEAGYHQNNMWPNQYVPTARCAVNSHYTAMVNNGWRRQNLLGDYHFEDGSNELTAAGKLKSKWILTQAPQDRRMIYIQRGENQSETASRLAAVHAWAGNQSPAVDSVLVNDTHIVAEGHTAGSVDSIFVGFQANQPAPVLTPSAEETTGN